MKKIVRLTESDLIRIVKRVLKEQNTKTTNNMTPDQKKFYDYVNDKWADDWGNDIVSNDKMFKICGGPCSSIKGTDADSIIWDWSKNQIIGTKSFGIDPKPIPLNSTFDVCKRWFDAYWK